MTQVGATLAGLLFVGLTISLPHVLGVSGYMSRAFAALFLQFEMLVIGLWGLLPAQNGLALGLEFVVTGAAFGAGIAVFSWHFPEDGTAVLGSLGPRMVRRVLAVCGTLLPVVAGIALIAGYPVGPLSSDADRDLLPLSVDRQCLGVCRRNPAPPAAGFRQRSLSRFMDAAAGAGGASAAGSPGPAGSSDWPASCC
ncbi:MAG: hypothetical protein WDM81_12230 [Rhizomicrobium sp.]